MKKLLFLIILLSIGSLQAQNIVFNSGFESITGCPFDENGLSLCPGWKPENSNPGFAPEISPLFHTCATNPDFAPTTSPYGPTMPDSSTLGMEGMSMIVTFHQDVLDIRLFAGGELVSPTVIGTKYYWSYSIKSPDKSGWVTNNLGILMMTAPGQNGVANDAPTDFDTTLVGFDPDDDWATIHGSFIADSVYGFVSIGNFFTDANTLTLIVGFDTKEAHYYIDNVCISRDSSECTRFMPVNITKPLNNTLSIAQLNGYTIRIKNKKPNDVVSVFNISGQLVKQTRKETVDLVEFPKGIYILDVNMNRAKVIRY